jgi:poly(A) polymerase
MLSRITTYLRLIRRKPVITRRQDHTISTELIDRDALKVLSRLNRAGYTAYLVGGGVRDLLLGRRPKDYDVSTDAHPHQIKELFRNCILIGRRFRLAHIRFGNKIIETSTFRRPGSHGPDADTSPPDKNTRHKRTNTFGIPEEDARMRDFTINGLFYDTENHTVIDYVGGRKDLQRRQIRCIGDPKLRFPDDPVRMLRAIRFASRLGFTIEKKTLRAIARHRAELQHTPPARLIEEIYRFFGFGTAHAAFRLLAEIKILPGLLPALNAHIRSAPSSGPDLWEYLAAFDSMQTPPEVARETAILAVLAYPLFEARLQQARESGAPVVQYQDLARDVLKEVLGTLPVPRRVIDSLARAFDAQRRFANPKARFSKKRFVMQSTFTDALFVRELALRARGEDTGEIRHWTRMREQFMKNEAQPAADNPCNAPAPDEKPVAKRRKRRRKRKTTPATSQPAE